MVIVDKWPDYVNDDSVRLYRYLMDHTAGGLREYIIRVLECKNFDNLDTFMKFRLVDNAYWESPNGVLRLFVKGFKSAVVDHGSELLDYLRKSPS